MGTEPTGSTSFGVTREGPLAVGRAAADHGLGALLDIRREFTPIGVVGRGAAGVVGCVVALLLAAGALGARTPIPTLGRTLLLWLIVALVGLLLYCVGWTVHALVFRTRAHYLFRGGLVHRRLRGVRAVAWTDVDRLVPVYNRSTTWSAGKLLGYRVLVAGSPFARIPLVLVGRRDAFVDHVFDSVGAPDGSAGARAHYQRVTDEQREIWRMHGARSMVAGGVWALLGAALLVQSVSRQPGGAAWTVFGCAVGFGVYRIVMGYLVRRKADGKVDGKADEKTAQQARV